MPAPSLFDAQILRYEDLSITYFDSASCDNGDSLDAERDTIVLIHGTGGSVSTHFNFIYPALAAKFRVIAFDLEDPTRHDEPLELDALVAQAVAVCSQLSGTGRTTVVGYSLGAVIAAATAAHYPQLVDRLVLISGWAKTDYHQVLRQRVNQQLAQLEDPAALQAFTMFTAHSTDFLLRQPEQKLELIQASLGTTAFSRKQTELNMRIDIVHRLADILSPTLVISATQDLMVPPHHQQQLADVIPNAQLTHIESGHGCIYEKANQVVRLIADFVTQKN